MLCTDGTGVWTQYSNPVGAYGASTVMYPGQWMYQQPICIVPQSWIGFVKLGGPVGLPVNSQFPTVIPAHLMNIPSLA
jgi:hypothetical protein